MKNAYSKAFTRLAGFATVAAATASTWAVDSEQTTLLKTELGTMKTEAISILAVAILIPIGFKLFAIGKRALAKA